MKTERSESYFVELLNRTGELLSELTDNTRRMATAHELSEDELDALRSSCKELRCRIAENIGNLERMLSEYGIKGASAYSELVNKITALHDITVSVIDTLQERIRLTDEEIKRVRMTQKALRFYKYHQFE